MNFAIDPKTCTKGQYTVQSWQIKIQLALR